MNANQAERLVKEIFKGLDPMPSIYETENGLICGLRFAIIALIEGDIENIRWHFKCAFEDLEELIEEWKEKVND